MTNKTGWGGARKAGKGKTMGPASSPFFSCNVKMHFLDDDEYRWFLQAFPDPRDRVIAMLGMAKLGSMETDAPPPAYPRKRGGQPVPFLIKQVKLHFTSRLDKDNFLETIPNPRLRTLYAKAANQTTPF